MAINSEWLLFTGLQSAQHPVSLFIFSVACRNVWEANDCVNAIKIKPVNHAGSIYL